MTLKTFKVYADGNDMLIGEKVEKLYIGSFEIDDNKPIDVADSECFLGSVSDCIDAAQDAYGYIAGTEIKPARHYWSPVAVVDTPLELLAENGCKKIKDFEWEVQAFDAE